MQTKRLSSGSYAFDGDVLEKAESIMAGASRKGSLGFEELHQRREELRDLLMLSIARDLRDIATTLRVLASPPAVKDVRP